MFKLETLPCFEPGGAYHGFDTTRDRLRNDMMATVVEEARVRSREVRAAPRPVANAT